VFWESYSFTSNALLIKCPLKKLLKVFQTKSNVLELGNFETTFLGDIVSIRQGISDYLFKDGSFLDISPPIEYLSAEKSWEKKNEIKV